MGRSHKLFLVGSPTLPNNPVCADVGLVLQHIVASLCRLPILRDLSIVSILLLSFYSTRRAGVLSRSTLLNTYSFYPLMACVP